MKKTGIIVGLIVLLGLGGIAGGYYYFVVWVQEIPGE